jgi:3-methyladenine DNA glycosylase/8-oxoguanine DNA glycosylase
MAEPDFLDSLAAGRDALRRLQQSLARYGPTTEQRQAVVGGFSQLMFPTDGVRALSDLIDAFGPPLAQIEALRAELAEQRELLSQLDDRLGHLEISAERLALAGEQILAFQEPFVRMAAMVTGQQMPSADGAEDADDEYEDAEAEEDEYEEDEGDEYEDDEEEEDGEE